MNRLYQTCIVALFLLLVGCSQQVDLTIWEGNEFSATIVNSILINEEQSAEEIAQELDTQVSTIRSQPNITRAEWQRLDTNEDEFRAEIIIEGNYYEAIEQLLEGGATVDTSIVDGREVVGFTYDFSPTLAYTLTLNSGDVISTNGEQVDNDTIRWNGGMMEAVITPKSRSGDMVLWVVGIIALFVLVGGGLLLASRRGKPTG
jgi:hypothetical protein